MNNLFAWIPSFDGSFDAKPTLITLQILGQMDQNPILLKLDQQKLSVLKNSIDDVLKTTQMRKIISNAQPLMPSEIKIIHMTYHMSKKVKTWLVKANVIDVDIKIDQAFYSFLNYVQLEDQAFVNMQIQLIRV